MKVQSKKDYYTVKCDNQTQTADVLNFIQGNDERDWFHWIYVSKCEEGDDINNSIPERLSHLPVISFEEWQSLPDEEFVLPEKWCIIIDSENYEYLNKYLHNNKDKYLGYHKDWKVTLSEEGFEESTDYFYSESKKDPSHSSFLIRDGFIEITFDQFNEHVLKEIPKPEYDPKDVAFNQRKVIGYKLIKPEYWESVSIIAGFVFDDKNNREENKKFVIDFMKSDTYGYSERLKEAPALSFRFDPVYEKESITLKSGVKLSEEDIAEVKEILKNK